MCVWGGGEGGREGVQRKKEHTDINNSGLINSAGENFNDIDLLHIKDAPL